MSWLMMIVELLPFLATISPLIGAAAIAVAARTNFARTGLIAWSSAVLTFVLLGAVVWNFDLQRVNDRGRDETSQMIVSFDGLAQSSATIFLRTDGSTADVRIGDESAADRATSGSNDVDLAPRGINLRLTFGIDGLTMWPAVWIALTVLIAFSCAGTLSSSINNAAESSPAYCISVLISEAGLLGSLTARDVIVSLLSCEVAITSFYFLIGRWGGPERRTAAGRMLLFQRIGSGLTLLGTTLIAVSWPWVRSDFDARHRPLTFDLVGLVDGVRTTVARNEVAVEVWSDVAPWACLLLVIGFAMRFPAFPFQRWYTHALEEASTGVACLLAIALPQVVFCGWVRFAMPLLAEEAIELSWLLGAAAALGAIHAGLKAASQSDLKKLAASLSMGHLALALLAMRLPLREGLTGAWLIVQTQGMVTAGLVLLISCVQERLSHRATAIVEGMAFDQPKRAAMLVLLLAASGTMSLASGAGSLLALSQLTWETTPFAACGIAMLLLMTWSLLVTSQRILFGRATVASTTPFHDLNLREFCIVMPFILLVAWLTLAPHAILKSSEATLTQLLQPHERRADVTK